MDYSTKMVSSLPEPDIEAPSVTVQGALSLKANFSWTFAGNIVYAGCQWGMLVVLAKIGNPEMVGQFALGLAITAPVILFTNLQLRSAQATDARGMYLFEDYFGLRLITTALALLIIAGIVIFSGYPREVAFVIIGVGVSKSIESISDVFYGLFQQRERMDRIAKSMLLKGPISLLTFGIGVYVTGMVVWGVVALAAAWMLILVFFDVRNGTILLRHTGRNTLNEPYGDPASPSCPTPRWSIGVLGGLAWTVLPLGFVMMLGSLNTNIPRYFVEHHLGLRELGIFSAMAYVIIAGSTAMRAMWQSASPRLAKYFAAGKRREFLSLVLKLMGIGAAIGVAGILLATFVGKEILTLVYSQEYSQHMGVFLWLMVAAAVQYIGGVLSIAVTSMRRFWVQAPINAASVLLTCIASAICIPRFGLVGAAWSVLIPYTFTRILFALVLIRSGFNKALIGT